MSNKQSLARFEAFETKAIDTCTTCPKLCRWACPVAEIESRETSSPHSLVTMSGLLRRGLAGAESLGRAPFHCSHCGACTSACLHKNDVPLILSLARARLLAEHAAPEEASEVRGHFGMAGNPYGVSLSPLLDVVIEKVGSAVSTGGGALYFPGCATLQELPEAAVDLLHALALRGITGVTANELSAGCCGLPLLWAGDLDGFRSHAARHAERLSGVDQLIVHDPACAVAMSLRYPQFGVQLAPRVISSVAFLAQKLLGIGSEKAELTSTENSQGSVSSVAYADSCHLCRGLMLVQEPRKLIKRSTGRAPIELPGLRGADSDCCGASGLLPVTVKDTATALAEARMQAFFSTKADVLAVGSPRCVAHLRRVAPEAKVVDLGRIFARL